MSAEHDGKDRSRQEGWEGLAGEEPSGGALEPGDELEAALAAASEAVEQRARSRATGRPAGPPGSADEAVLEALSNELQALKAEYEAQQRELEQVRDKYVRLQAEFENFRRRTLKDKQETQLYGHMNFVKELLATVDNLERAIEHSEKGGGEDRQSLLEGVELVRRELLGVLERFGVTVIDAHGERFDPSVHEALAQVPTADVDPNTVVSVMQKGYQLRDRMLRPARVVVSKPADEDDAQAGGPQNE